MKMKNEDFLESFMDHLHEEEKSKGTIEGYAADIRGFFVFVKKDIRKVTRKEINAFKDYLKSKGMATPTINRKLVSVKRIIDFINERFDQEINVRIKPEKVQKAYSLNDDELLTFEDYEKIIAAVETAGDIRTKALLDAMYYTGMRVSEALQLRTDHVIDGLKTIHDIKGKGSKYRPVFVSKKLSVSLNNYLKVRKQPFASTTKLLFVGERGPMTRQTAHHLIKKYAKAAGIEESKAHVHNLRHLFGLRMAEQGVPIQDIAKYMGHSSIEITRIYLEKPQSHYENLIDQL